MASFCAPTVTEGDLRAFHTKHFPLTHAPRDLFLRDNGAEHDISDDGLGWYNDGTKRHITDEQIAIFRHSEIFKLVRDREIAETCGEQPISKNSIEDIPVHNGIHDAARKSVRSDKRPQGSDQARDWGLATAAAANAAAMPPSQPTQPPIRRQQTRKRARKTRNKANRKARKLAELAADGNDQYGIHAGAVHAGRYSGGQPESTRKEPRHHKGARGRFFEDFR